MWFDMLHSRAGDLRVDLITSRADATSGRSQGSERVECGPSCPPGPSNPPPVEHAVSLDINCLGTAEMRSTEMS